ncbi:MAG: hypothetical protein E6H00_13055 [Bacillati bacterium ANGP1]|uniref:Uncharacterized protein n=1 Tax=Candidatus Segetimicrobium genomatis TaxID=2569760 RepID=A0A537JYS0_9BACT|nr:MAG: hypothetical protein E6H00_13055 [Terrabacteria group bacterium ANGP1]
MKPGDIVQVQQTDHAILRAGEDPAPVAHWVYATVLEPLKNDSGALVEIDHPGNVEHGRRRTVSRKNLRTLEDLERLHAAHPHRALATLSYDREEHKSLINLRAAIARMKPEEPAA